MARKNGRYLYVSQFKYTKKSTTKIMTFSLATGNPVKILEMSSNYVRSVPRKFFKKIKKLWSGFEDLMKPRCLPTLFIDRARKKRNNNNNPFA